VADAAVALAGEADRYHVMHFNTGNGRSFDAFSRGHQFWGRKSTSANV